MSDPHARDEIRAKLSDQLALTLTIWGESRGEPVDGQIAVGCVVRNRVRQATVPRTYAMVCLAPWQFSCWWEGSENADKVFTVATALLGGLQMLPDTGAAQLRQAAWIATGIISGDIVADPSRSSSHYLTTELLNTHPPSWAKAKDVQAVIGHHSFLL